VHLTDDTDGVCAESRHTRGCGLGIGLGERRLFYDIVHIYG
jgi:hypothetical protein